MASARGQRLPCSPSPKASGPRDLALRRQRRHRPRASSALSTWLSPAGESIGKILKDMKTKAVAAQSGRPLDRTAQRAAGGLRLAALARSTRSPTPRTFNGLNLGRPPAAQPRRVVMSRRRNSATTGRQVTVDGYRRSSCRACRAYVVGNGGVVTAERHDLQPQRRAPSARSTITATTTVQRLSRRRVDADRRPRHGQPTTRRTGAVHLHVG